MDEVFIRIQGVQHYLWRAPGAMQALPSGFQAILQYVPRVVVTGATVSLSVSYFWASSIDKADMPIFE
jgi:hypothetical protein